MTKGILGRKVGMTQVFTESGELIAVTAVEATPNVVLQVKNIATDGYNAIQLGYQDKRTVLSNKPEQGHASKANTTPKRYVREVRDAEGEFNAGDEIKVDTFQAGDYVDVTGITKGHGFQGAIKKLGQSRGPMAHGSRYHRRPGSMPGRMGNNKRTMQNVAIVHVDVENNLLLLKGNVPGANKSLLTIKSTVKVNAKHPEVKMAGVSASATTEEA